MAEKLFVFRKSNIVIPNLGALPKIGAGHDGTVYRYDDFAVKLLKYNTEERSQKDLMTFKKATYFADNLDLRRIAAPVDTLLDENGNYAGYVMPYLHDVTKKQFEENPRRIEDFTCGDLFTSIDELQQDAKELTKNKVSMEDLNRFSFIYTDTFLHMCDTDKYKIVGNLSSSYNETKIRYIIAKFLTYQITKEELGKQNLKIVTEWCKKNINDVRFFEKLRKEIYELYESSIGEFVEYKKKDLLR